MFEDVRNGEYNSPVLSMSKHHRTSLTCLPEPHPEAVLVHAVLDADDGDPQLVHVAGLLGHQVRPPQLRRGEAARVAAREGLGHHAVLGAVQQLDVALHVLLLLVLQVVLHIEAELRGQILADLGGRRDVRDVQTFGRGVEHHGPGVENKLHILRLWQSSLTCVCQRS